VQQVMDQGCTPGAVIAGKLGDQKPTAVR
jgi:hypothetical protein